MALKSYGPKVVNRGALVEHRDGVQGALMCDSGSIREGLVDAQLGDLEPCREATAQGAGQYHLTARRKHETKPSRSEVLLGSWWGPRYSLWLGRVKALVQLHAMPALHSGQ